MIFKIYSRTAIVLCTAILCCAGLEVAAGVVLSRLSDPILDEGERSSYFTTRPWAKTYHQEFRRLMRAARYHPYTIWRFPPFQGRYINTDEEGVRVTPASCKPTSLWMFGGSAMWGFGAPDDGTIAAHVQRTYPGTCVRNFGQIGYVSTQGVITLESELQKGLRPRSVVFYDGVNETVLGTFYLQPGLHPLAAEMAERFERETAERFALPFSLKNCVTGSSLFRLVKRLAGRRALPRPQRRDAVAEMVVAVWAENHRIVQALGQAYHFEVAFFWQPTIYTGRKPLTKEEQKLATDTDRRLLFQRVQERVARLSQNVPGLYDLTGVLDAYPERAYLDWHHLTMEANEAVAQAMLRTLANRRAR